MSMTEAQESYLTRMDPRIKLIGVLMLTVTVFMVTNLYLVIVFLVTFLALWFAARLPGKYLTGYLKFLSFLIVFIIVLQMIFYPDAERNLLGILKLDGLIYGIVLGIRLCSLILLMPMLTMTTPLNRLALGMTRMGLPYKAAYIMTTTMNMVPMFQSEIRSIQEAQKMRGMTAFEHKNVIVKAKAYPALVTPLVIGGMRRAQQMGIAMDSRAFGAFKKKTYVSEIRTKPTDWVALVLVCLYCAAIITANYYL